MMTEANNVFFLSSSYYSLFFYILTTKFIQIYSLQMLPNYTLEKFAFFFLFLYILENTLRNLLKVIECSKYNIY